jgi:hypothetical protein
LGGVGFSFYLPFSNWARKGVLLNYLERFVKITQSLGLDGKVAVIAGKILFGLILCIVVLIVFALLNKGLEKLAEGIQGVSFFRIFDGSLSCLIYFVLGAAICTAAWVLLYALTHYDILQSADLFTSSSKISSSAYELIKGLLQERLQNIKIGK